MGIHIPLDFRGVHDHKKNKEFKFVKYTEFMVVPYPVLGENLSAHGVPSIVQAKTK